MTWRETTSRETQPAPAGIGGVTKWLPNPGVTVSSVRYQLQSSKAALEREERQDYTAAP